ncbi:MAG: amylo-alpha-1,6-glucosidase [Candidatus Dormibacteraceae bacterium]
MDQLRGRDAPCFRSRVQAADTASHRHHELSPNSITERVILKHDRFFAVSAPDGSMRATERLGDGVWFADTRILSEFRLLIGGVEPDPVDVRMEDGCASFELAAGGLRVTRTRYMDGGLRERIRIANPGPGTVEEEVELVFAADFAAMLAIRGNVQLPPPVAAPAGDTPDGLVITRRDWPGQSSLVIVRPAGFKRRARLGPGKELTIFVDVLPGAIGATVSEFDEGLVRTKAAYPRWLGESVSVRTDNPAVNELLGRSLSDLRMLCDRYPTGLYPTGGLPWYAVPFGRDQLIASMMTLPVNPGVARGVLRYLAARQGRRNDPGSEEQPGKILHEVRTGEVVDRGLWPHHLFGTIDATPLFLCALAATVDWTGDESILDELWTNAEAAVEWCAKYGDIDEDGYIEYRGARARNQGWKDSDDSVTHVDGSDPPRPVALCEVQAYLYRGLLGMSRKRPELKERAEELRWRFDRDFWMADERYVAQALDGSKRRVEAITSNPGHCLWAGILPPARATSVAERLVSPELFNGWGIRTLSTRAINYDPVSYHNGSVWPFDTALAAAGLRLAGFPDHAERVARALMEAGMAVPLCRLPELWRGDEREGGDPPADYPGTCSPQSWSAASAFSVLTTMLGLNADATRGRLTIAPIRTPLWRRVEVTGLHFAGHRIDFAVDGKEIKAGKLPRGITLNPV